MADKSNLSSKKEIKEEIEVKLGINESGTSNVKEKSTLNENDIQNFLDVLAEEDIDEMKIVCKTIFKILNELKHENDFQTKYPFLQRMLLIHKETIKIPSLVTQLQTKLDSTKKLYTCEIGDKEKDESFVADFDNFKIDLKARLPKMSDKEFNKKLLEEYNFVKENLLDTYKFGNSIVSDSYGTKLNKCLRKMLTKDSRHYVYVYWKKTVIENDQDEAKFKFLKNPVYIGIGGIEKKTKKDKKRIFDHIKEPPFLCLSKDTNLKQFEMRKLASEDNESEQLYVRKIVSNCSELFCEILEGAVIDLYGLECLTNVNNSDITTISNKETRDCIAAAALSESCNSENNIEEYRVRYYQCTDSNKCEKKTELYTMNTKNEFIIGCEHHFKENYNNFDSNKQYKKLNKDKTYIGTYYRMSRSTKK